MSATLTYSPNPVKLFHDGREITTRQAGMIAKAVIEQGGIDGQDVIDIFARAVHGEAEAREEFFDITGVEIV